MAEYTFENSVEFKKNELLNKVVALCVGKPITRTVDNKVGEITDIRKVIVRGDLSERFYDYMLEVEFGGVKYSYYLLMALEKESLALDEDTVSGLKAIEEESKEVAKQDLKELKQRIAEENERENAERLARKEEEKKRRAEERAEAKKAKKKRKQYDDEEDDYYE